ncbi:hypothetical protein [Streptomyces sp. JW3]|uniref:hypothetical protein n=1 Tax=Streptomyces sp. JW3 TaxID=3456955 RepID=UPI003FA46602
MHEVLWAAGTAGGVLCLGGRLRSPARQWLPRLAALVAMVPMAPGVAGGRGPLVAATVLLGVALLWQLRAERRVREPAESVNLAAMAALTAAAAVVTRSHHGGGGAGAGAAGFALWPVLFAVACWAVARAAAALVRQAWPPRRLPLAHPPARRARLLGAAGGALMVTAMAVMLGLP